MKDGGECDFGRLLSAEASSQHVQSPDLRQSLDKWDKGGKGWLSKREDGVNIPPLKRPVVIASSCSMSTLPT